jgi:hypothetical protein
VSSQRKPLPTSPEIPKNRPSRRELGIAISQTPNSPLNDKDLDFLSPSELISKICTEEAKFHPSIPVPRSFEKHLQEWLHLLKTGALARSSKAPWLPSGDFKEILDGAEGIQATLKALTAGMLHLSEQSEIDTELFTSELVGAQAILKAIPFSSDHRRTLLIEALLRSTLTTSTRSCIRRAVAFYNVFSDVLTTPVDVAVHGLALQRVYDDLCAGSVRTFRHFIESPFRTSQSLPARQLREAAFRGTGPAIDRVLAKPSKCRLESLAYIVALGCANVEDVWTRLRSTILKLIKANPAIGSYAVDLFFPVSIKGAPHSDDFLRREIKFFHSVDQSISNRMQRHYTAFFPLDWDNTLRGRVPHLPPTIRGFVPSRGSAELKDHLINRYVPARRSTRITDGFEIVPAQSTSIGRLSGELFSIGYGAFITIVAEPNIRPHYASSIHSIVINTACIDPRSHPSELYLALGKAFNHIPRKGSSIRITPNSLSSYTISERSDRTRSELISFAEVAAQLFEVRWLTKRMLGLIRGDEGAHTKDEKIITAQYDKRIREKMREAETSYNRCREQLFQITQYLRGELTGSSQLMRHDDWLGIKSGVLQIPFDRTITETYVPLYDVSSNETEIINQAVFNKLIKVDPLLRSFFDETVTFVEHTLSPHSAHKSLVEFIKNSDNRRVKNYSPRTVKTRSSSFLGSAIGKVKSCIYR